MLSPLPQILIISPLKLVIPENLTMSLKVTLEGDIVNACAPGSAVPALNSFICENWGLNIILNDYNWFFCILSGVHDHSDSHCFMKMMEGQLKETLYAWPRDPSVNEPLNVTDTNIYKQNEVTYICGKVISDHI